MQWAVRFRGCLSPLQCVTLGQFLQTFVLLGIVVPTRVVFPFSPTTSSIRGTPHPPSASTVKIRKIMVRRSLVLCSQSSAHKRKPKRAVGKATVRRVPVLRQGSVCPGGGGATKKRKKYLTRLIPKPTLVVRFASSESAGSYSNSEDFFMSQAFLRVL